MAGTKRKADASRSSSSVVTEDSSTQNPALTAKQGRGTRSTRTRAAAASSAPSLIVSLNTSDSGTKETTATEASNKYVKEPRAKRRKLSPKLLEVPKPSRSSARLKARARSPLSQELPPQLSPRQSPIESSAKNTNDSVVKREDVPELTLTGPDSVQKSVESLTGPEPQAKSEANLFSIAGVRTRKRKLEENTSEDISTEVSAKKQKIEGEKLEVTPASSNFHSPSGSEEAQDTKNSEIASETVHSPSDQDKNSAESQDTETIDNTSSTQNENAGSSGTRGRGNRGRGGARGSTRGRGRGGASARGSTRGKGRGGGRGGIKGGKRNEDDSDMEIDYERSPSPGPAAQKLGDRQKELGKNFKRLAATQKLILSALAGRTQQRLARDKNAHRKAPEYEEVQAQLEEAFHRREEILQNQLRFEMEQADRLLRGQVQAINDRYEANVENIREEHFYAARGEYMRLVEGAQHARDDEHTEPDVDGPVTPVEVQESVEAVEVSEEEPVEVSRVVDDTDYRPKYLDEPQFERGFNSKHIRETSGAGAYEMGKYGFDDFTQRAKMNQISQEESDPLQMLLQACVEALEGVEGEDGHLSSAHTSPSLALSALADVASNAQPATAQRVPMPVQSTEPPSFLLPRPSASRPVLSAPHGLSNMFATGGGVRQLPPPPGVAFAHPGPMPGFLPGQHQQQHQQPSAYPYQPPPTPARPPPAYFPGPPQPHPHAHQHQHQPPPHTQPPTARRY